MVPFRVWNDMLYVLTSIVAAGRNRPVGHLKRPSQAAISGGGVLRPTGDRLVVMPVRLRAAGCPRYCPFRGGAMATVWRKGSDAGGISGPITYRTAGGGVGDDVNHRLL